MQQIIINDDSYVPAEKLKGKVALITGGDSGIGAAVAIAYAKEGAHVVINYLNEIVDAQHVIKIITNNGGDAMSIQGDVGDTAVCQSIIKQIIRQYKKIDVLVNNAGTQVQQAKLEQIPSNQIEETFRTNVFSMFYLTQAALPFIHQEGCIINTTSVTAYRGSEELIDYSATKGAIVTLTRSLSQNLAPRSIRVNAVAPGPVWTPLVLTSFDEEKLKHFGTKQPLGRAAQPIEIAPAYVFLASRDARYITGQVIHVNGGEIING